MSDNKTEAAAGGPQASAAPVPSADAGLEAWHTMLLRLAGTLPDDLIAEARAWLAEGGRVDVAQAVGFAAVTGRVPVLEREAELMARELREAGEDAELIDTLDRVEESVVPPVPWVFSSTDPRRAATGGHFGPLDLTVEGGEESMDDADLAVCEAVEAESGPTAVWRAWRSPADASPWPAPRRVFVVQAGPESGAEDLVRGTARLQEALTEAGEEDPQVEMCGPGWPVPGYQSSACAHAALLWAAEPAESVRLARVFDAVDAEQGPSFDAGHPQIEDLGELTRLLQYLGDGLPVLTTSATMPDILDPQQPDVVPLTFRTDGRWIWTDTISFYLERYGLAPEPDLLAHLRQAPETGPEVSDVALHRVLSFLQRPDAGEPVWTVPQVSA